MRPRFSLSATAEIRGRQRRSVPGLCASQKPAALWARPDRPILSRFISEYYLAYAFACVEQTR
jgi:hypothetical protein